MIKLCGILTCVSLGSLAIAYFLFKALRKEKQKSKQLEKDIETQQKNLNILNEYAKEIQDLQKQKYKIDNEIDRAKNDEEILSIVNTILADNNRLCNNKEC